MVPPFWRNAQILRPHSHYEGNYWRSDCFSRDKNSQDGNKVELIPRIEMVLT